MKTLLNAKSGLAKLVLALLATLTLNASAQTPVDDDGKVIGDYESAVTSSVNLDELVGPIALYPDDLLAIVLPASAYPLQIVSAGRFLEDLENDPSLKPDPDWDDSVVALLNYPEVIELMNDDIDWTWRLGEAVVSQQADVVAAIEAFRDRAYAAGNLKSDSHQNVAYDDGVIEITPVEEDVIYVPYYEPERVVVYQPRPVYYYYPRRYPVYYYPYSSAYRFDYPYFWGVTTAFTIGWLSDSLHVYHHSYHGHPYYGYRYRDRWWYRRTSINVYNTTYANHSNVTINRYYNGDRWHPRNNRRHYDGDQRVTHNRYNGGRRDETVSRTRSGHRETPVAFRDRGTRRIENSPERRDLRTATSRTNRRDTTQRNENRRETTSRQSSQARQSGQGRDVTRQTRREPIEFRARDTRKQSQQREPVRMARQQSRESSLRQPARQRQREPVQRQQTQKRTSVPRATQQRRSEPVVRQRSQQRSAPQRSAPQRSAPQRSAPQRSAPQRSAPQRQARPESQPKQQRSESRRNESRGSERRHSRR